MNTETKSIEMEVLAPDDKLVKYANQTGLEKTAASTLAEAFKPILAKARTAIDGARGQGRTCRG